MPVSQKSNFDVVVIGAGLTGMYQLYKLRELGLSVRGIDANGDIGGTWNMNRYPGCKLDTESYTYSYSFLRDLLQEWDWSEEFAGQPEILEYLNKAAEKMDIRKDIQFNTRVVRASYREEMNRWEMELDNAEVMTAKFLISAVGPLSAAQMPKIEGIDLFRGESFHSYYWPHENDGYGGKAVDFSGKRVGVIGTGATGVQIISEVAKTAAELVVFQRHPNWCAPLCNSAIDQDRMDEIKRDYDNILAYCNSTTAGFQHEFLDVSAQDVSAEEREALFEDLYYKSGYGIWVGNYPDIFTNKVSNDLISDFIARKIRQRVKDPKTAEALIPKDHGFGLKRVPMEDGYYEAFNQDNVTLVDLLQHPIEQITPNGVKTTAQEHQLDVIIYATGFDGIIGSLKRIDIKGRGGKTLKEAWADGPVTYLGLQIPDFPNFFTLIAAHNGATFCNIPRCSEAQVEWLTEFLRHALENGVDHIEPEYDAAKQWTAHVYDAINQTLFPTITNSWFFGNFSNSSENKHRYLVYSGGNPAYRQKVTEVAENNYQGFSLSARERNGA